MQNTVWGNQYAFEIYILWFVWVKFAFRFFIYLYMFIYFWGGGRGWGFSIKYKMIGQSDGFRKKSLKSVFFIWITITTIPITTINVQQAVYTILATKWIKLLFKIGYEYAKEERKLSTVKYKTLICLCS